MGESSRGFARRGRGCVDAIGSVGGFRHRRSVARLATAVLFAAALMTAGCGTGDAPPELPIGEQADNSDVTSAGYRAILGNALSDTLSGPAGFGTVLEPESRQYRFVIRLASGFDFAGGIIFARSDTAMPETGEYQLETATDSLAATQAGEFAMFYREGMLRELRATSGTLTLSTVTDTLIAGTFDATLRGNVASLNLEGRTAEVHVTGRFRAGRELRGYVIGL